MASRNNCLDTFYNGWEVFKPVRAHGRLKLTMEMKDRYSLIEQSLCSDWHGAIQVIVLMDCLCDF